MPEIYVEDLIIEKFDPVLEDILDHGHTHYTFPGGRGGTKSSFIGRIIPLLITQNPDAHAVIFRRYANTMRDSVYAEIITGIASLELGALFKCTVSPMEITYKPTSQKIMFRGYDEPEKIKSIKVQFGYIAITWWEELDQYPGREAVDTGLRSTMRGGDLFWNFESFNPPITAANWANKDVLIERPDRLVVRTTYLDVPPEWLGTQFIVEAEHLRQINPKSYQHVYMGEAVGTGGMVFDNVITREITDEEIKEFDRIYHGVDFGYFPDPWAYIKCSYQPGQGRLFIFGERKAVRAKNRQTGDILFEEVPRGEEIICDSAEPKSIADYIEYGLNAVRTEKKPGSVDYSMKWLQSLKEIIIDPERCPASTEEFLTYEYERDKDGEIVTGYPDKNNHFIDGTRYALNRIWTRRGQ